MIKSAYIEAWQNMPIVSINFKANSKNHVKGASTF